MVPFQTESGCRLMATLFRDLQRPRLRLGRTDQITQPDRDQVRESGRLPEDHPTPEDGLVLHLSEHHGDCCPGSTVFVWMTGVEEFHREISAKNYKYLRPGLETTFYDSRCVQVIDPFGNRIRFNEELKKTKKT